LRPGIEPEGLGGVEGTGQGREKASGIRNIMAEATQRIEAIIDTAERVAGEIESEARADADRYLEQRRRDADRLVEDRAAKLRELSTDVAEHAETVQRDVRVLLDELARAAEHADQVGVPTPAPEAAEPPAAHAPESQPTSAATPPDAQGPRPVAYPGTGAGPGVSRFPSASSVAADESVPEEALLRATQMAVAGNDRAEIERTLAAEFGVESPGTIVDEILGPASS
jgi:hypothetical protein